MSSDTSTISPFVAVVSDIFHSFVYWHLDVLLESSNTLSSTRFEQCAVVVSSKTVFVWPSCG